MISRKENNKVLYVRIKESSLNTLRQLAKKANLSLSKYVDAIFDQVIGL